MFLRSPSSSINVPSFHSTWLDTFWRGLVVLQGSLDEDSALEKRSFITPISTEQAKNPDGIGVGGTHAEIFDLIFSTKYWFTYHISVVKM